MTFAAKLPNSIRNFTPGLQFVSVSGATLLGKVDKCSDATMHLYFISNIFFIQYCHFCYYINLTYYFYLNCLLVFHEELYYLISVAGINMECALSSLSSRRKHLFHEPNDRIFTKTGRNISGSYFSGSFHGTIPFLVFLKYYFVVWV
jgi:hypothetical protein